MRHRRDPIFRYDRVFAERRGFSAPYRFPFKDEGGEISFNAVTLAPVDDHLISFLHLRDVGSRSFHDGASFMAKEVRDELRIAPVPRDLVQLRAANTAHKHLDE